MKCELRWKPESRNQWERLAVYTSVQESVLDRTKKVGYKGDLSKQYKQFGGNPKGNNRGKFIPNEVWKAQQLKAYQRTNGLCFHCGEKYSPDHRCANQAQLKAIELEESPTYLSEEILDVITSVGDFKMEDVDL